MNNIDVFMTENGSVYRNIGDSYQRYKLHPKRNETQIKEPMDLTVFVPSYEDFIRKINPRNRDFNEVPKERLEEVIGKEYSFFLNPNTYHENISGLLYHPEGPITSHVINENGIIIRNNKSAQKESYLSLVFHSGNEIIGKIPVILEPKIDYSPFEYRTNNGESKRHLGHKIIGISYKNGYKIEK